MAQISTSTTDAQNFDPVAARATLNAVRTRLVGSKTIRAQDIRDIINVYNAWTQHNHVVYDQYYIGYGNKSPYGTQGANVATSLPILPDQLTDGLVAGWSTPGIHYYTVPGGLPSTVTLEMTGGGGGGGGSCYQPGKDSSPGAGGGSARHDKREGIVLTAGMVLKITVGAAGAGGNFGTWTTGATGGAGGISRVDIVSTGANLGYSEGGYGGAGGNYWSKGIWGGCGVPGAIGGSYYHAGGNGGSGNYDPASSYQPGNGGGVGGAAIHNVSGGPGVKGFVGAAQGAYYYGAWRQNQGAGGGGLAGSGTGMHGGLGGGGGGGSLGGIAGGNGGSGYVGIYSPAQGAILTGLPTIAAGNNIILDDIRNLMALINAIRSHLHQINDGYL